VPKEPVTNVAISAKVPRAFYQASAEAVAGSGPARQTPLGWFDELTAPGFRLVWEEQKLFLVALAGLSGEDLVAGIERRRQWIKKNGGVIQGRVQAIVGSEGVQPKVWLRVVVPELTDTLTDYLVRLGEHVDLRVLRLDLGSATPRPFYDSHSIGTLPQTDAAGPMQHTPPQLRDFWVELSRTAAAALRRDTHVDCFDWRTDPQLNLLRVYALLVVIARALVADAPQKEKPTSRTRSGSRSPRPSSKPLEEVLGLLADFAKGGASGRFTADERWLAKALKAAVSLAKKHLRGEPFNSEGAYLGSSWRTPVPPGIQSMISEMARSVSTRSTPPVTTQGKKDEADWLADANFGVAAAVHIAKTFDDRRWPGTDQGGDPAYVNGALVRVLASHRLLLELLGLSSRSGATDLLTLADEIAESKTFDSFFSADSQDQSYLSSVRRRSLAILAASGALTSTEKKRGLLLKQAKTQEQFVLAAMEAAIRSGG